MDERKVEKEIEELLQKFPKSLKLFHKLKEDEEVNALLEQANRVAIGRLGYNDHGRVHAKITVCNALKILELLENKGFKGNLVTEGLGDEDDERIVIILAGYLHDIGMCTGRENHEFMSAIFALPIIERLLSEFYPKEKIEILKSFIIEGITCHMGNRVPTSLEAKIITCADGTDMTKGRGRIPYKISKPDMHNLSVLAIEKVEIKEGKKKPVRIEVLMSNAAGIFQVEYQLLEKIKDSKFDNFVEIVARLGEKEFTYLL